MIAVVTDVIIGIWRQKKKRFIIDHRSIKGRARKTLVFQFAKWQSKNVVQAEESSLPLENFCQPTTEFIKNYDGA